MASIVTQEVSLALVDDGKAQNVLALAISHVRKFLVYKRLDTMSVKRRDPQNG